VRYTIEIEAEHLEGLAQANLLFEEKSALEELANIEQVAERGLQAQRVACA
jgi:hypothetical protein